jgi:hypothetical protein
MGRLNSRLRLASGLVALLALPAALLLAQFQINPQVNTGIYAGPGPTSVRYANTYCGADTVFNVSSRSADTRQGMAGTGVYAPNGVINGGSPSSQSYTIIPQSMNTSPSIRYAGPPSGAMVSGQANGGPINAQVSGAINQGPR